MKHAKKRNNALRFIAFVVSAVMALSGLQVVVFASGAGDITATATPLQQPTGRTLVTLSEEVSGLAETHVSVTRNGANLVRGTHFRVDVVTETHIMVMFYRVTGITDTCEIIVTVTGAEPVTVPSGIASHTWPYPLWIEFSYELDFDLSAYPTYLPAINEGPRLTRMADGRAFNLRWFVPGVVFNIYLNHPVIPGVTVNNPTGANLQLAAQMRLGFRTGWTGTPQGIWNGSSIGSRPTHGVGDAARRVIQVTHEGLLAGNIGTALNNAINNGTFNHFVVYSNNWEPIIRHQD